ncbi:DNA cytosine methyltransferase [Lactobacillus amylovorus]|jgi:hypothetical protein|uniref:hypothetical protein n=2 Tax=Bacteria TaxID=2 RepID=UPI003F8CC366
MKVLVACEYSGVVRDAMRARGHDAMSCDILPTDAPGPHYQGDVRDLMTEEWDLVIAHPPCTYLANSGVSWLKKDPDRWTKMKEGAEFFRLMGQFNSPRIAIENPIQHRYAVEEHGLGRQTQVVQPWMFGHPEMKATGLWLYGLPKLEPTDDVRGLMELLPKNQQQRLHYLPPSEDRWKLRSTTFSGLAAAMADQWGSL